MTDNLIHVKLEHDEALQSKKDILSSEMNLLRITKRLRHYKALRKEEMNLKIKLLKKLKEEKTSLTKLHKNLPILKIPQILKKQYGEEPEQDIVKKKIAKAKARQYDSGVEGQLQEIQDRLNSLQG